MTKNTWKIAFCNLKGGVGKTMLSVQFVYWLSAHGKKTLLVDADYQGNASSLLLADFTENTADLANRCTKASELFSGDLKEIHPFKLSELIDIIPSEVADVDLVNCSFKPMETSLNVAKNIAQIENLYDYVIFDCPPSLGTAVAGPLIACDRLIVPVALGANFQESLSSIQAALAATRQIAPKLKLLGYVVNRLPRRSALDNELFKSVAKWLGRELFTQPVHDWITILRAGQTKKPVFSLPNKEPGQELSRLFDELLLKLEEKPLGNPKLSKGK